VRLAKPRMAFRSAKGMQEVKSIPRGEEAAQRASRYELLKPGLHNGRIGQAFEKVAKSGNEWIELTASGLDGHACGIGNTGMEEV
jgi:hypothetical protein